LSVSTEESALADARWSWVRRVVRERARAIIKIEDKTTISGRRDGMSRSSQLYFVRNVKIHCVIALTFRLRPTRANEKKIIFHFPPRVYARWSIFSPFSCRSRRGEEKLHRCYRPGYTHSPDNDINQATTFELHSSSACFGDAASVGIIETIILCLRDHRYAAALPNVCECRFFIFAKIVPKSIHISALWK
jgi:hypothetical protein